VAVSMREGAIFLDKDGTLVENVPYNVDPDLIRLVPGAVAGLRALADAGYRLFVVSNQSGVARGLFSINALDGLQRRIRELFRGAGVSLDGLYFCPHHPAGSVAEYAVECSCRKPAEGLLLQAARDHVIDLRRSWMIGDILDDVEAGRRAGCRTVLIDSGNETEWVLSRNRMPDHVVRDMGEAAAVIEALDAKTEAGPARALEETR
jgi:D-glycero-D-manno-heptose 1,7-bisphosphate phosphatase